MSDRDHTAAGPTVDGPGCIVLLPHSYTGRGPAESCVQILDAFPACGWNTQLFVLRARRAINPLIAVTEGAGPILRRLPFRYMKRAAGRKLFRKFARAIDNALPGTIAWFWPDSPIDLVRRARARGLITVREMINSPLATARPILDAAYARSHLAPAHGITPAAVAFETEELALYDFVFASNPEVESALRSLGIADERILLTSFGWDQRRFSAAPAIQTDTGMPFRACFVGLMNVRKGIPDLVEAWKRSGITGELVVAGSVEPCLQPLIQSAQQAGVLTHVGHVSDVASLYRQCDVFVFPTLEEGGPQVTYEAASCGLPVITTPMGAARLVEDGKTGLVVEPGNVDALAQALQKMAADAQLRKACGKAAQDSAADFEYGVVGRDRARILGTLLPLP